MGNLGYSKRNIRYDINKFYSNFSFFFFFFKDKFFFNKLSIINFSNCLFSVLNENIVLDFNGNLEQFDLIFHSNKSGLDLIVTCLLASGLIGFLLLQAQLLNLSFYPNSTFDSEKYSPYECGFSPFKTERSQFDIKFYLVALLFLVFDVELMFLLPYCLSYYYLGLTGYIIFIVFFSNFTYRFFSRMGNRYANLER